jgi:hypothetical protein
MVLNPRHYRIAGRRVSRIRHRRLASGFAFGPRFKIGVARDLLLAAVTGALTQPFVRVCHPSSQAPDTTEISSERLAHRRAAIRSNGVAAFSITAFTRRQGVGTL